MKELINKKDEELYNSLSNRSRDLHQESVRLHDKMQSALCFITLGGISFITGMIFLVLSFKRVMNKLRGIDPASLQFILFVLLTILGVTLLVIGIVRYVKAHKARKTVLVDIDEVAKQKDALLKKD